MPNNCTDQLQSIDLSVNKALKDQLQQSFKRWYAEQVQKQMENGIPVEEVKVDLRISVLKELEAKWMLSVYDYLNPDVALLRRDSRKQASWKLLKVTCPW